jgi:transcriptional regulator with XRE-family HTH domain
MLKEVIMEQSTNLGGRHQRSSFRKQHRNMQTQGEVKPVVLESPSSEVDVGYRLRTLRLENSLSIRTLAEMSGLNVNTLSLIENGKTSPSVSTLQQLAQALQVPITAFFTIEPPQKRVVYQKAGQRSQAQFLHGTLEDLGAGITMRGGQPLLVILEPGADSGLAPIVHTGHEFVFCLEGQLTYLIEEKKYLLEPGDSLLFEAHLSHRWGNESQRPSRSLLILCPTDENDHPTDRHFKPE